MTTLELDKLSRGLGDAFASRGKQLFLVGGGVRDRILGRGQGEDLDYATDARPTEIISILNQLRPESLFRQGEKFGTIGAKLAGGRKVEVTTFRGEWYEPDSRKPEVVFSTDLETDLSRRDFRMNAMALDAATGELLDPFGGVRDMKMGLLNTPVDPHQTFRDDPLRMIRAARFVSTFGFHPSALTWGAAERNAKRLEIVSRERIVVEMSRLLVGENAGEALRFLARTKLLDEFLPTVAALKMEGDGSHMHKDVLEHTFAVVERCEPDLILRWAALLHDVGKPVTRRFEGGKVTFHAHDVEGAKIAKRQLRDLKVSKGVEDAVVQLVEQHLRFHSFKEGWTDSAMRRYVRDAGKQLDRLNALVRADCTTQKPARAARLAKLHDQFEVELAALAERENLANMRPALNGTEIMERLQVGAGPVVGAARRYFQEIRMDRGEIDRDEALSLLDSWYDGYLADRASERAEEGADV